MQFLGTALVTVIRGLFYVDYLEFLAPPEFVMNTNKDGARGWALG